jgi:hypothetical protein
VLTGPRGAAAASVGAAADGGRRRAPTARRPRRPRRRRAARAAGRAGRRADGRVPRAHRARARPGARAAPAGRGDLRRHARALRGPARPARGPARPRRPSRARRAARQDRRGAHARAAAGFDAIVAELGAARSGAGGRGRLHLVEGAALRAVELRTGATDGAITEITAAASPRATRWCSAARATPHAAAARAAAAVLSGPRSGAAGWR